MRAGAFAALVLVAVVVVVTMAVCAPGVAAQKRRAPPVPSGRYGPKKTAVQIPGDVEKALAYAEDFLQNRKPWNAIKAYQQILTRWPDLTGDASQAAAVYNNLAIAYAQDVPPNPTEAVKYFGLTLSAQTQQFERLRADMAEAQAKVDADATDKQSLNTVKRLRSLMSSQSRTVAQTHYNLGYAQETLTRNYADALESYKASLEWDKTQSQAYVKAAFMSSMRSDYPNVIKYLTKAVELNPNDHSLFGYLGDTYNNVKQFALAIASYARALVLQPKDAKLHVHIADTYSNLGYHTRAFAHYSTAIKLKPRDGAALVGWYNVKAELCDWDQWQPLMANITELVEATAVRRKPQEKQDTVSRKGPGSRGEQDGGADGVASLVSPYQGLFLPLNAPQQRAVAESWAYETVRTARSTAKYDGRPYWQVHGGRPALPAQDKPKLRIGYLSRRFEEYPGTQLMLRVFGLHNREQFEVYAYANGADDGSAERRIVRESVDVFRGASVAGGAAGAGDIPLHARTPLDVAKLIAADQIDVLIDYDGAHNFNSLAVLALRPAPVQISWLGFAGTTGAKEVVDYLITDQVITPANLSQYFTERLLYMPHTYQPQDHMQPISTRTFTRAELGLPADPNAFVFACFNRADKFEPTMFGAWMRVLKRVPGSVLWLYVASDAPISGADFAKSSAPRSVVPPLSPEAEAKEAESDAAFASDARRAANKRHTADTIIGNLIRFAAKEGVSADRLVFAHKLPKPDHLARHRLADLFLDTRYYGAHTTASDALYAGLPVLTTPGDTFASRVGTSLVLAAQLPELVAWPNADAEPEHALDAFVDKAVHFAGTPEGRAELQALRARLAARKGQYALFDTPKFVRDLEALYRDAYVQWFHFQRSALKNHKPTPGSGGPTGREGEEDVLLMDDPKFAETVRDEL